METIDMETVTTATADLTVDEIQSRHRKERKELQAKIQALKKNAPKSDKKKRKETMEEIARLELEMDTRQEAELQTQQQHEEQEKLELSKETSLEYHDDNDVGHAATNDKDNETPQRVTKAQKRRDKKAREARQREEEIRAAAETDRQFEPKEVEARLLKSKLKKRQLALHNISSDGDCLYNAVRHQLQQSGLVVYGVKELRKETANYIRAHKNELLCYMINPKTDEVLNDEEFEKYCEEINSTSSWGGQIELKALSTVLKVPIEVLQAEGSNTVQGADEFAGPNLIITYHRNLYSLGEHYNSTVPLLEENSSPTAAAADVITEAVE